MRRQQLLKQLSNEIEISYWKLEQAEVARVIRLCEELERKEECIRSNSLKKQTEL